MSPPKDTASAAGTQACGARNGHQRLLQRQVKRDGQRRGFQLCRGAGGSELLFKAGDEVHVRGGPYAPFVDTDSWRSGTSKHPGHLPGLCFAHGGVAGHEQRGAEQHEGPVGFAGGGRRRPGAPLWCGCCSSLTPVRHFRGFYQILPTSSALKKGPALTKKKRRREAIKTGGCPYYAREGGTELCINAIRVLATRLAVCEATRTTTRCI